MNLGIYYKENTMIEVADIDFWERNRTKTPFYALIPAGKDFSMIYGIHGAHFNQIKNLLLSAIITVTSVTSVTSVSVSLLGHYADEDEDERTFEIPLTDETFKLVGSDDYDMLTEYKNVSQL